MSDVIITNKALTKMAAIGISESQAIDVFNKGTTEVWTNQKGYNAVRKYNGYEIGVAYFRDFWGKYRITSVWKRSRR